MRKVNFFRTLGKIIQVLTTGTFICVCIMCATNGYLHNSQLTEAIWIVSLVALMLFIFSLIVKRMFFTAKQEYGRKMFYAEMERKRKMTFQEYIQEQKETVQELRRTANELEQEILESEEKFNSQNK